jgi:hypothetical protein
MNAATSDPSGAPRETPPITSRTEFEAAVAWGVQAACARNARRIYLVDPDFSLWPLGDASLHERLSAWLRRPLRKLVLLARDYAAMPRLHPRFVAWRRDWSHAVEPWALPEEVALEMPSLLVDDGPVLVQLIDTVHWRGRTSLDPRSAHLCRETIDALLQRSEAAFPVHHLGL